jgi:hypothetical protein
VKAGENVKFTLHWLFRARELLFLKFGVERNLSSIYVIKAIKFLLTPEDLRVQSSNFRRNASRFLPSSIDTARYSSNIEA